MTTEGSDQRYDDLLKQKDAFLGHGVVRDPYPEFARLLERCPVHVGSPPDLFGVQGPESILFPGRPQVSVLSYDGVEQVFKDSATFSACWYQASLRDTIGRTILEMDPPDHGDYRQLIQHALSRKEMQRWESAFVRDLVDGYLDEIVPAGRADLVSQFAIKYPLSVLVTACDLPTGDVEMFYGWAAELTNVAIAAEQRERAGADFGDYLVRIVRERREQPGDDLISLLATATFRSRPGAEEPARGLTDDEAVSFLRLLLPAGAQTTYRTLCNLLLSLLTHPEQLRAIYADPGLIPQAVEEGLRWEPPLINFGRIAIVDTSIEGMPVPAGTVVNVVTGAAGRDPKRWDTPDAFDIFRPPRPHLAFGSGNHVCLGISFARMELKVAMEQIIERLPDLRLDPDAGEVFIGGFGARSPDVLPVVFG